MEDEILLESGTNEVEILEFYIGHQSYGINVAKVLQIELYNPGMFTKTPGAGEGVLGVYLWRGETLLFMDLAVILNMPRQEDVERPIVLVTEFNNVKTAFLVDGINQVYRVSWEAMRPVSGFLEQYSSRTTATVNIKRTMEYEEDREIEILMLDFESIMGEYCPESGMGYGAVEIPTTAEPVRRENAKIVIAEDSAFLRQIMSHTLEQAQYSRLKLFENGQAAFNYIAELKKNVAENDNHLRGVVDCVISDIEMPLMDGLTLCRRIKKDLGLTDLPVVFFSSLINEQMELKCKEVGGDAQITKPEVAKLVSIVDGLCLDSLPQSDMD